MWDNHGGTFLYFAARHDGSLVEPGYWTCSLLVYCASSKFYITYRVSQNMLHFKILIKTHCFYAFMYESAWELFFIKGHIIIIHDITCVSNDIIDDVINFAKFSVAGGTDFG